MARSLEGLLESLLEASGDKDKSVRESVSASLSTIGHHQHDLFFRTAQAYLSKQPRLPSDQRGLILSVMNTVSFEVLNTIEDGLAGLVINMATQELTMNKDTIEEWQGPASSLLVTMSRRFSNTVMDSVLQKLQPGFTPHCYVLYTLGAIATTNPFGFVPFLSDVMSRTVPMLGSVKTDVLKRAFATSIRQYCEAVLEYLFNLSDAPDPTVTKDVYATQMSAAYEVLLLHWLSSKDYKVKVAVIECLGEIFHVIPSQKLHDELRRIIPTILSLYKKSTDYYPITKGLSRLLEAAVLDESCPLEPYLEEIWIVIFPQVCEEIDYANSISIKNQSEVLRCFHVSATRYSDKLVYYLLQKIQGGQEKHKLGALAILRHLINSSGPFMEDKRITVVLGLKPILTDSSTFKVKKALCHLAVAMADHGYLEADGGLLVVEFLVKNLITPSDANGKRTPEDPAVTHLIRTQCSQALFTMANNISNTQKFLWPYLFEFVCQDNASPVLFDLFRCIDVIAQRLNEENNLTIEATNARVPGPHQLMSRLVVTLCGPIATNPKRCQVIVRLLKDLSSVFHPSLPPVISRESVALEVALEDSKITQEQWEILVLKFVSTIVVTVADGTWRCDFAAALGKQFHLYNNFPEEKQFLFRCMGGVLAKITDRQFVVDHLELMFHAVNAGNYRERQGCGKGIGYCGHIHTDIVLTKLENVAKWEHQKKSGGFFGFIKDSIPVKTEADGEIALLRANIMLCYGYLLYYCAIDTVTQRLEDTVLRFLKPYMENPKDPMVMESLLETFYLIATTVHPDHLKAEYTFSERNSLLGFIKDYVKSEQNDVMVTRIRYLACKAAAALARLNPPLRENEVWALCTVLGHHIYPLTSSKDKTRDPQELTQSTLVELHSVYEEIIKKQATVDCCTTLLKVIQPWFTSPSNVERERALDSGLFILKTYYTFTSDAALGRATDLSMMGSMFGRFCPRMCDSVPEIRVKALECVHMTLALGILHKGLGKEYRDTVVDGLLEHASVLKEKELQEHLIVISQMSKIIGQKIPPKQIQTYISVLFEMLLDKQPGVSCAAALLLKLFFNERGVQLQAESEKVVSTILSKLSDISNLQTYAETLQSFISFAHHHLALVVTTLLSQSLPLTQGVVDCWHTLSRDGSMLPFIMDRVLEAMEKSQEKPWTIPEGTNIKIANSTGLRAVAAFIEVIKGGEPEELIQSAFPRLLTSVLAHCGCYVDTQFPMNQMDINPELRKLFPSPAALVHSGIKTLLLRARTDMVMHHLTEKSAWKDFEDPLHYSFAVSHLANAVAIHYPEWVRPLSDQMHIFIDETARYVEPKRIVAAAVLSAFTRISPQDGDAGSRAELLDILVSAMMKGLADSNITVRKLCVRGMGNTAHFSDDELSLYSTTALSAMMAGLEDPGDYKDEVALESMQGLNKLSSRVSNAQIEQLLTSVLLRIRPCFEKESGALRSVAFNLFGELSKYGDSETYVEQIHTNIISILLHLNDEEQEVRTACCFALGSMGPLLDIDSFATVVQEHVDSSASYGDVLREVCKKLIASFTGKLNFYALNCSNYYKSGSARIRANAAMLTGYLLGSATPDLRNTVSKELIFGDLSLLLKDPNTEVRLGVTEAIANLYAY